MPSMESTPQWVALARILRPQGRKGEVLADLLTDFPERFRDHPTVWLAADGFADASVDASKAITPQQATIAAHWLPLGKNAGRIVLHFAGVDSIEQAEKLAAKEVVIPRDYRMPLDPGAEYISDLIGCTVYDGDLLVGTVDDVHFPATPDGLRRMEEAAPLLSVIASGGAEILVPFVKAYLRDLDIAAKTIRMALPQGLTEINLPQGQPSESD